MALSIFPRRKPDPLQEAERTINDLRGRLEVEEQVGNNNAELFIERLAELELALEDQGWLRLDAMAHEEFSRDGLGKIVRLARLMYLKNPLIKRPVQVQSLYVWARGVTMQSEDDTVNEAIQAFIDDRGNRAEFFSHQAQALKEVELQCSANLFFVYFVEPRTGTVRLRSIPFEEVQDVVKNPEDRNDPWFYLRQWNEEDVAGNTTSKKAYYPDWNYRPATRPTTFRGLEVRWEGVIQHVKEGGFPHWKFGVPEVYAALNWARAYTDALENDATRTKALARLVWNLQGVKGKSGVAAARAKLNTTYGSSGQTQETNPPPSNPAVFIGADGVEMRPVNLSGATLPTDHARPLRLQVAAATGLPETFLGDADVGNHATSKTLDRPTELKFTERQELWKAALTDMLLFVVRAKNANARGELQAIDPEAPHIDVDFPDLLEKSVEDRVKAIAAAATLDGKTDAGTLPRVLTSRLLMQALGVDDVDEELANLASVEPAEDEGVQEARRPKGLTSALLGVMDAQAAEAEAEVLRFLQSQQKRVVERFSGIGESLREAEADDLLPLSEDTLLTGTLGAVYARVLRQVQRVVAGELAIPLRVSASLRRRFLTEVGALIKDINNTTRFAVRDAIQDGLAAGESVEQITERLRQLPEFGEARARTIARTEVARAVNHATLLAYGVSGVVVGVRVSDGDFDATCRAMNGRKFRLKDAPSELEHPNCRRVFSPITDAREPAA